MKTNHGFVRVGAGVPAVKVGHIEHNVEQILTLIKNASENNIKVLVLPELCLTGYTCGDLFHQPNLIENALKGLNRIKREIKFSDMLIAIGLPLVVDQRLYNVLAILCNGEILGFVAKSHIPNYGEFYEKRWFHEGFELQNKTVNFFGTQVPIGTDLLFKNKEFPEMIIGAEICEDLWTSIPPSSYLCANGATIILNGSASNEYMGKSKYRKELIKQQSARCKAAYLYSSAGASESSTDTVFGGANMIAECGEILAEGKRFVFENELTIADIDLQYIVGQRMRQNTFFNANIQKNYRTIEFSIQPYNYTLSYIELKRNISPTPFIPKNRNDMEEYFKEILLIQTTGLMKRLKHTNMNKVVVGVSGGLDSTWALLVCHETFKRMGLSPKNILGITMPGFGTTKRTMQNAIQLMRSLDITMHEIDITKACLQHFADIGHGPNVHDVVYENAQARERTQILMDIANQENALVIGTGNMTELALGWMTYNGDHMSMYAINGGIPKTLLRSLVQWRAENEIPSINHLLFNILDTPISPELLPADQNGNIQQLTENSIGDIELNDFFMYHMLKSKFNPDKIVFIAKKAFKNKFSETEIINQLKKFYKRFFANQFKRSCIPDGVKVCDISLSPRADWRMPSDACVETWLDDI